MLGLEQRAVAARLGVTTDTVRNWEKGRTQPPNECIPAVVRAVIEAGPASVIEMPSPRGR